MRPVDPTVLRRLPSLRRYVSVTAVLAAASAILIVAQALALSIALSSVVLAGRLPSLEVLAGFAGVVAARAAVSWGQHTVAARSAATVKAQLRGRLLSVAGRRDDRKVGESATLITKGVDGLDAYITGYLPQLCLAATVPVAVLIVFARNDLASLLSVVITLPLIPVFGILIGWHTKAKTQRQWRRLSRLGGHFLEAVAGLSTLRTFGRAAAQAQTVQDIAHRYRSATMETLRVAFLSALVLELVATVSVALVAVPIGLRLLSGDMDLRTA
ncbi:MAG: ABC transporter transmembrane domain-containing protein, partial [Stackebrandtia sp.]